MPSRIVQPRSRSRMIRSAIFIIFLRKDQELDRLPVSVQYGINDVVAYEHFDKTEYDLFHVMEKKERRTDNDEIAKQQGAPDRDIFVFVDDGTHYIRPSGTAVCRKDKSETGSAKECSDHDGHERLVVQ